MLSSVSRCMPTRKAVTAYFYPLLAKLSFLHFHPLEVVSRYIDTQLQVGENYSHLLKLGTYICESRWLNTYFTPSNSELRLNKMEHVIPSLALCVTSGTMGARKIHTLGIHWQYSTGNTTNTNRSVRPYYRQTYTLTIHVPGIYCLVIHWICQLLLLSRFKNRKLNHRGHSWDLW